MVWEHPTAIVLLFVAGYVILFLVGASIVTVKIDSLQLHRLKNFGSGGATSFGWFQWILSSNELKRIWRLIKMLIQIFGSQEMTIRNTSNRLLAIWWQSDEKIRKKRIGRILKNHIIVLIAYVLLWETSPQKLLLGTDAIIVRSSGATTSFQPTHLRVLWCTIICKLGSWMQEEW